MFTPKLSRKHMAVFAAHCQKSAEAAKDNRRRATFEREAAEWLELLQVSDPERLLQMEKVLRGRLDLRRAA